MGLPCIPRVYIKVAQHILGHPAEYANRLTASDALAVAYKETKSVKGLKTYLTGSCTGTTENERPQSTNSLLRQLESSGDEEEVAQERSENEEEVAQERRRARRARRRVAALQQLLTSQCVSSVAAPSPSRRDLTGLAGQLVNPGGRGATSGGPSGLQDPGSTGTISAEPCSSGLQDPSGHSSSNPFNTQLMDMILQLQNQMQSLQQEQQQQDQQRHFVTEVEATGNSRSKGPGTKSKRRRAQMDNELSDSWRTEAEPCSLGQG